MWVSGASACSAAAVNWMWAMRRYQVPDYITKPARRAGALFTRAAGRPISRAAPVTQLH
jgi:hypothetical protein